MANDVRFRVPPSSLQRDGFVALYGGVYEHSPQYAERVFDAAAPGTLDTLSGLSVSLRQAVNVASPDEKLALIRAHPDLANRLGAAALTIASASEQAGAGLDQCTPAELEKFLALNNAYQARFGIPFIKAVRGFSRAQILEDFESRLANDPEREFVTALEQIHRIAWLRLSDLT